MAQKYIIIKQYIHAIGMHNNCEIGYLKCTAAKKSKKAITKEYEENDKRIKDLMKMIKGMEAHFCETRDAGLKRKIYARLINAYGRKRILEAFKPLDYALRSKTIDRHTANELIDGAKLVPVITGEDGIIWDTPEQSFKKYQGNISISTSIGY